jgi:hypothetical protein
MNQRLFRTWLPLALCASAAATLAAQTPAKGLSAGVKVRAGITFGDVHKDLLENKMTGLGLELAYGLGGGSAFFGEVTYLNLPGNDYWNELPASATRATSVDLRKNLLSGISIRGGYRSGFGLEGLAWQAGLAVDRFKSRQEVSGQIVIGTVTEGLAVTPESSKVNIGAFGGLHYSLGESATVEANLVSFGYGKVNWVPTSYSGAAPAAQTTTRRGFMLEVAFGFKF